MSFCVASVLFFSTALYAKRLCSERVILRFFGRRAGIASMNCPFGNAVTSYVFAKMRSQETGIPFDSDIDTPGSRRMRVCELNVSPMIGLR